MKPQAKRRWHAGQLGTTSKINRYRVPILLSEQLRIVIRTYVVILKAARCLLKSRIAGSCHRKNGPGKNGSAGPILDEKMVRPDQYWPTKYGPAGPILVTKSGPVSRRCLTVIISSPRQFGRRALID